MVSAGSHGLSGAPLIGSAPNVEKREDLFVDSVILSYHLVGMGAEPRCRVCYTAWIAGEMLQALGTERSGLL